MGTYVINFTDYGTEHGYLIRTEIAILFLGTRQNNQHVLHHSLQLLLFQCTLEPHEYAF